MHVLETDGWQNESMGKRCAFQYMVLVIQMEKVRKQQLELDMEQQTGY